MLTSIQIQSFIVSIVFTYYKLEETELHFQEVFC